MEESNGFRDHYDKGKKLIIAYLVPSTIFLLTIKNIKVFLEYQS